MKPKINILDILKPAEEVESTIDQSMWPPRPALFSESPEFLNTLMSHVQICYFHKQ